MIQFSLALVAAVLAILALFVWCARPGSASNRWFAAFTISMAGWAFGIAALHSGTYLEAWAAFTFASASLIPPAFLAFTYSYPARTRWPSIVLVRLTVILGCTFAFLSLTTPFIVHDVSMTSAGFTRKPGLLYKPFALYFVLSWSSTLALLMSKWRSTKGNTRIQLQYLGSAITITGVGGITANLLLPLTTGHSTYSWIGPYFGLAFTALIAHAIIRHRLMDLRLVVHRGLTFSIAVMISLLPVAVLVTVLWPQLSNQFNTIQLILLLVTIAIVSLLVPLTRDTAEKLLDRYVYRTHANYQQTISEASNVLARVLDLETLLSFLTQTIASSTESEGISIYLRNEGTFQRLVGETRQPGRHFETRDELPGTVSNALTGSKALLLADGPPHDRTAIASELTRLNWALVLPILSEDMVIGAVVVGYKLSGDPYYSQDLDLLTTLANQAGVAIKNAQLYEQVVLANEFIQNVVATIESGVVAINASGRITMFNRAAERLTGLSIERMSLQNVSALPSCLADALTETVKDGQLRAQPEIGLPQGTTLRPVICTTSPLRNPTGGILGAVTVFSDLTSLKELEIERQKAERLAYFGVLASGIAHEIKNPLVAIKTFAQLVPRRHKDEEFVEKFGRIVTREVGRMEHLVERLRTLSQLGDRPLQPLDLRLPIIEALELLQAALDEKQVTVISTIGDMPCYVLGNQAELEQLFLNLLMNAHEAMPSGGRLSVALATTGDSATASIADSGPGIPPDLLERVFDPFFTTKQRGSGLGLAVCAGIAQAHQAKLRAANRSEGGALFTVEFPLVAAAPARAPA